MSAITDVFDLAGLRLTPGEGRRLELAIAIEPFTLSDDPYTVAPAQIPVLLEISRMTGGGYALRLRFEAHLHGACMRCLEDADADFQVDAREVSQPGHPGADDELESDYIHGGDLELGAWARDALALMFPAAILCQAQCAGLCPVCGVNLNTAGPDHRHDTGPDPRWSKLSELKFDA